MTFLHRIQCPQFWTSCQQALVWSQNTEELLAVFPRMNGWTNQDGYWICPIHSQKKEKKMLGEEEIEKRFGAVIPQTTTQMQAFADVRNAFIRFAKELDLMLPDGRSKSIAFTELQDAKMWASAAVAEIPSGLARGDSVPPVEEETWECQLLFAQDLEPGCEGKVLPRVYKSVDYPMYACEKHHELNVTRYNQ